MEIIEFNSTRLHNEEHCDFGEELVELVENVYSPATLSIEAYWAAYKAARAKEDAALELIVKSAFTDKIAEFDLSRDSIFRGTRDIVTIYCNHFNIEKKEMALRLKIVFDHYGNISVLSYGEETASINNLCAELETNYASELAALGLTEWVTELKSVNLDFKDIRASRFTESANKNNDKMKVVRMEVDAAYKAIVKRINSAIEFNGPAAYKAFVLELNARIENYKNVLAQRRGHSANGSSNDSGESNDNGDSEITPTPL